MPSGTDPAEILGERDERPGPRPRPGLTGSYVREPALAAADPPDGSAFLRTMFDHLDQLRHVDLGREQALGPLRRDGGERWFVSRPGSITPLAVRWSITRLTKWS